MRETEHTTLERIHEAAGRNFFSMVLFRRLCGELSGTPE